MNYPVYKLQLLQTITNYIDMNSRHVYAIVVEYSLALINSIEVLPLRIKEP